MFSKCTKSGKLNAAEEVIAVAIPPIIKQATFDTVGARI